MRIIISPAKKMNQNDDLGYQGRPVFLEKTKEILGWMKGKTYEELKTLWGCNDSIATLNYERVQNMNLEENLTPALLSYEGIQYQYMAPIVFEDENFSYVEEHLRILSGFYGVVKPMDGVTPYRLEMQAKAPIGGAKNLYDYWGETLYREVLDEDRVIVNLASKEYSKCIEKYLEPEDRFITCVFGELQKGKVVQKGTYAKMARGSMVRYMAQKQIKHPEEIKSFDEFGYQFSVEYSSDTEYIFIRE